MPLQPIPDINEWWKYFSPMFGALFGYLGGLITPATREWIKFREISKKLNLSADLREQDFCGVCVHNGSHYPIHGASATIWINFGPRDIVEVINGKIFKSNRRQLEGDFLPWAADASTPLGLRADFNPGETQRLLFARKDVWENLVFIASEDGIDQNARKAVALNVKNYEGIIKIVSADSFPIFYEFMLNAADSISAATSRLNENAATEKILSYKDRWNLELAQLQKEEMGRLTRENSAKQLQEA